MASSSPPLSPTISSLPTPTRVYVSLLPRSHFASNDELLSAILTTSKSLTPNALLTAPSAALYPLLTLIICAIEHQHQPISSDSFKSLSRALRDRCAVHRVLKYRLLTALNHAAFPLWDLQTVVRRHSYITARSTLRAQYHELGLLLHDGKKHTHDINQQTQGEEQGEDQGDEEDSSRQFCEYIARKFLFARGSSLYIDSFTKHNIIHQISNIPSVHSIEHATTLFRKLLEYSIIYPDNQQSMESMEQYNEIIVYTSKLTLAISDADTYQMKVYERRSSRTSSHSRLVSSLQEGQTPTSVALIMPCDIIDLQSLNFWTKTVYQKNFEPGTDFGIRSVIHPLLVGNLERDGNFKHDDEKPFTNFNEQKSSRTLDAVLIEYVVITKVFSSLSRPCLIELRRLTEGLTPELIKDNRLSKKLSINPKILLKKGDNLMQDHCVSIMFQVFNFIWRHSSMYANEQAIPHCYSYEVVPTTVQMGFIECIANVVSLGEVDWSQWYARHANEPSGQTITNLLLTAAGAFVGGYVLGATDRHWGNMVLKDDCTLLHIDFSFILGDAPPIDAPRISVPPQMEKLFKAISTSASSNGSKQSTLWDAFTEATVTAFLALRKDYNTVLNAAEMLFTHAGFEGQRVRTFLAGKSGLAIDKSEKDAAAYLRKKILSSSGHWKTNLKRFVHDVVNPAWYAMVQKGPVPTEGVMKLINRYQSESATTVKLSQQQEVKKTKPNSSASQQMTIGLDD